MPVEVVEKLQLTCANCGHVWQPEKEEPLPRICPKCKSVRWNISKAEVAGR
jgi:Zn finger protein HypA/HybF involved in hydrogenase expression